MLGKFAGCLFITWICHAAWAASSLTVQFDAASPRELWLAAELPSAAPTASIKTDDKSVAVPTDNAGPKDKLYVWDKSTGLLAELKFTAQSTDVLKVGPSAFGRIFRTTVRVEHEGKPVAGGLVLVEDGERKPSIFLAPTDKGEVSFYGLRLGQIKVSVQVKAGGETKTLPAQIFDLNKPTEPNPKLTIAVAEDVAVVEPPSSAKEDDKDAKDATQKKEPEVPPSRPMGTIVVYLMGLAIVIGGVWYFLQYAKKNPKVVEDNLKKLGVGLPDPNQDGGTVDPIPVAPQPQPIQPIILDASATPDPVAAPINAGPREPALIGPNGERFALAEGSSVVGREAGLGVSLTGESSVSRAHAEVVRQGDRVTVRDTGSTNGTYVNGAKINSEVELRPGDSVQFGSVRMRVEG